MSRSTSLDLFNIDGSRPTNLNHTPERCCERTVRKATELLLQHHAAITLATKHIGTTALQLLHGGPCCVPPSALHHIVLYGGTS